ncbi:hypothetical protein ACES2I_08760 [Bdellovibrio bacteriovorus]|uniref:hypothetical protein n=1 Tax=Bdellovibrio bacteriovorus TaxID=959 RepID=UPI0035A5992C
MEPLLVTDFAKALFGSILSWIGNNELFVGFVLGLFGNIWVSNVLQFPRSRLLQYLNWLAHPVRTIGSIVFPSFWQSRAVVKRIFTAWEREDISLYSSQWSDDAIQVTGFQGEPIVRGAILDNFKKKMGLYEGNRTSILIVTNFERLPNGEVLLFIFYQSRLVRKSDRMPVIEEANEIYRIAKKDKRWVVTHNFDHFKGVEK